MIGLTLQDGIGSEYSGKDRATEDAITINGKAYKLNKSKLTINHADQMAQRTLETSKGVFTGRECRLTYTPQHYAYDGLNLGVVAFMQDMTYGYYNGKCVVEGKIVKIENMWGLMETVHTRL